MTKAVNDMASWGGEEKNNLLHKWQTIEAVAFSHPWILANATAGGPIDLLMKAAAAGVIKAPALLPYPVCDTCGERIYTWGTCERGERTSCGCV
jgi:hypothetical protein